MAGEFDDLLEPEGKPTDLAKQTRGEFDDLLEPVKTNEFEDILQKAEPVSEGQKALKSLMSTATKAAVAPAAAAIDLFKGQAEAEGKRLAATPLDPIKFNQRDLANPLENPINALGTAGKIMSREEAAVAAPLLDVTKAALKVTEGGMTSKKYWDYVKEAPKIFMEGMKEGLHGDSRADADPERQEQLGDIPRLLGASEPVSAALGLAASFALPSSLLMSAMPGPKYLSKAENLATNMVARNKWLAEFNAGKASLAEGKAMIEKLVTQDLEPEALVHLANWRKALRDTDNAEQAVKLMSRGEAKRDVLETGKGIQATTKIGPMIAKGIVDAPPVERGVLLLKATRESQVPISVIQGFFGGTNFDHPALNPYKGVISAVTDANYEHMQDLSALINPANHGLREITDESAKRIRLYDLVVRAKHSQPHSVAAQVLGESLGIKGLPKLSAEEKAFYDLAKKLVNKEKDRLRASYKYITGEDMKYSDDYVFPLMHEKEARTASQIFSEKLPTGGGKAVGGGTQRFRTPTVQDAMPRTDVLKLLDEQLQAQAWMKHVLPATRRARTMYMGTAEHGPLPKGIRPYEQEKGLSKYLDTHQMEYINNLLNGVERGGVGSSGTAWEQMAKNGRHSLTKAMLSFKVSTALVQYGALFDGMTLANQLWGGKGARAFFKSMQENLFSPKFEKNFSKAVHNRRSMGSDFAVAEMSGSLSNKVLKAGWAGMKRIDATVAQVSREAFKKAMKDSGIPTTEAQLDMLMEVVSGSSNVAMMPSIINSNEFVRTWLTFQTFALHRWSLTSKNLIEGGLLAKSDIRNNNIAKAFSELAKPELFAEKIRQQPFATLSAWKDGLSDAVNLKNMGKLEGTLKRMGYRYKRASGGWYDPASGIVKHEASLFVPGMSEEEAVALGKKFNQYSVFTPHGEIRSDGLVKKISNMNDVIIEWDGKAPVSKVGQETIKKDSAILRGTNADAQVTKMNGEWRSTTYLKDGTPSGHSVYPTFEKALEDARLTTGVLSEDQIKAASSIGMAPGRITADKLPFTEIKLGDRTVRFHVPQGKVQMIRPGTLTKHVQGHDVIAKKIRAAIGLMLIAAAEATESKARSGIADLLSGQHNTDRDRSFGGMMMTAIPSQIPVFGNFVNSALGNSSALPPVPRTIESMVKGGFQTFRGKTGGSRARGALKTAEAATELFVGMPGTSQVVQFLKNFIPEK